MSRKKTSIGERIMELLEQGAPMHNSCMMENPNKESKENKGKKRRRIIHRWVVKDGVLMAGEECHPLP